MSMRGAERFISRALFRCRDTVSEEGSTRMTDHVAASAVSSRRGRAVFTMMFAAMVAVGVALAPPAAALHVEQYIEVPQCQPATSQACPQSPEVRFTAGQDERFQVQFTANANHCSDILVRFNVDNYPQ